MPAQDLSKVKPSAYSSWKKTYRIGTRLEAVLPQQRAGRPAASLHDWLDDASFEGFAARGTLFGSQALPRNYTAGIDRKGFPWLWHGRTRVLIWPVRISLGSGHHSNTKEDVLTLYHYTCEEAVRNLQLAMARGAEGQELLEVLTEGSVAKERWRGAGFPVTTLEPAKFARHRDLLVEVLRPKKDIEQTPSPRSLGAASHCVPLMAPISALVAENATELPDRAEDRPDRVWIQPELLTIEPPSHSLCSRLARFCAKFSVEGNAESAEREAHELSRQAIRAAMQASCAEDGAMMTASPRSAAALRSPRRSPRALPQDRKINGAESKHQASSVAAHATSADHDEQDSEHSHASDESGEEDNENSEEAGDDDHTEDGSEKNRC
eukprot:TRINITY_DN38613_c0_g1_i1.p1 TRINITY_DN38613_c0_g1~~TRINITY_DN38613_c0_g1_i1.p1  ORF type:complete len:380 (+),score=45.93 TRINITY_DN38613_c0_g1_i1:117-1256(+)